MQLLPKGMTIMQDEIDRAARQELRRALVRIIRTRDTAMCSGCGKPCAECADGCSDHLDAVTTGA